MRRLDLVGEETAAMEFDEIPFKRRPKFNTKTRKAITPAKTTAAEESIRQQWIEQNGKAYAEFTGAVRAYIEIARPLAKSRPKKDDGMQDVQKPDADNICKAFLDALNGVAYKDDSQVVYVEFWKRPRQKSKEKVEATVRLRYYLDAIEG